MKIALINGVSYTVFPVTMVWDKIYIYDKIAMDVNGVIIPIAKTIEDPGVFYNEHKIFGEPTSVPYRVGPLMDIPINSEDDKSATIADIIKEKESQRDLAKEWLSTKTKDNIFIPFPTGNEAPEMKMLKQAIAAKCIDINKYEDRFGGKFQNDKRLLNKDTISLDKLKTIANALDIEVSLTITDKPGDIPNPMNTSFTGVITDTDDDKDNEWGEE